MFDVRSAEMFRYLIAIAMLTLSLSPAIAADEETHMTNAQGDKAVVKSDDRTTESSINGGSRTTYGGNQHERAVKDLEKSGFKKDK
jgi:hypothetical protein